jgi:hypothetical protein
VSYPYPVEPTYPLLGWACGSTNLYQRTVACEGLSAGSALLPWLTCAVVNHDGPTRRATAPATRRSNIERVHSPCGASVYRLWFPTRRVRGQHGQPARSAMFAGCGPCRPVCCVNARPEDDDALWWWPVLISGLSNGLDGRPLASRPARQSLGRTRLACTSLAARISLRSHHHKTPSPATDGLTSGAAVHHLSKLLPRKGH